MSDVTTNRKMMYTMEERKECRLTIHLDHWYILRFRVSVTQATYGTVDRRKLVFKDHF